MVQGRRWRVVEVEEQPGPTVSAVAGAANQTDHTSMQALRGYIRHGTVFTDNVASTLGL